LGESGLDRASSPEHADIVVLNTCTVTSAADHDARASIRRIARQNPHCQIVVTGCYAQRAPDEIAALPGVTRVIGNSHKHELASLVLPRGLAASDRASRSGQRQAGSDGQPATLASGSSFVPVAQLTPSREPTGNDQRLFVSDIFAHTELVAAPVFDAANERTRPNLKVQDGCDNRCSFCIIPYVRGQSRSLPLERVIAEVKALVAAGYQEVVISGINLGRWGRDLGVAPRSWPIPNATGWAGIERRLRFEDLIRAILDQTSLEKLRISSVEPMDWSDELIRLVATSQRIAKHAHVPMQSASDRILRAMHRKYRPWHYREKIEKIRAAMPTSAIGADVMVGFPGEADADFDQTRRAIEELPFTYLHVFTYSSRPGTPAALMPNQIPAQIARERNRILRDLSCRKTLAFMRSLVGTRLEAITLSSFDGEGTRALTDNYLKLKVAGKLGSNQWISAYVESVENGHLMGKVAG
jgi:threonylcarbamoyladenosine tRNA methylthiotransferase MtaB